MKPQTRRPLKPSAKKALILVALIAGMCHLFGPTAHANGLIPAEIWLTFDYKTAQLIHLEGIQLVRCPTSNCEQPALLQQYGTCSVDGCLSSSPELPKLEDWMGEFECAGNRCRAASYGYPYEGPYFKLVVQFSDQARTSEVMNGLPLFPGDRTTWRVIVQDTDLSMTPDTDFKELNWRYGQYRLGLVLTQLIELLVAGLYLLMVVRVGSERLVNRLIMIFLINLATFPVVWFLFPAFSQFQFTGMRLMGIFGLIVATLYALALVRIYTGKGKARTGTIVLAVSSLPLTLVCMVFMLFATYFGHANVSAVGLPPEIAILASEIFAVVSEAALIYILSRKSLSLRHAGAMSLLTNAASFFFCLAAVGV
jgi:hypothetical protein